MDPIMLMAAALAAGAAAGLKPTAEQAVKDAYGAVKALLRRKYANVDLGQLERQPDSEAKRQSLAEDLQDSGAAEDQELIASVERLVETLESHDQTTAAAVGVNLEEVRAAFLSIRKVDATGTGVKVKKGEFTGGIDIGEVRAGLGNPPPNP